MEDFQPLIDGCDDNGNFDRWSFMSGLESLWRSDASNADDEQASGSMQLPVHHHKAWMTHCYSQLGQGWN